MMPKKKKVKVVSPPKPKIEIFDATLGQTLAAQIPLKIGEVKKVEATKPSPRKKGKDAKAPELKLDKQNKSLTKKVIQILQ